MKSTNYFLKLLIILMALLPTYSFATNIAVTGLKCEYHINPVGFDIQKPRLSWKILSDVENVMQTAYEIRVADSRQNLKKSKNRLIWSSGKVESDNSVNVEYSGPVMQSMQRVYWQVRIWDNTNNGSAWSEPAFWTQIYGLHLG